jgi:hypothetical protein
MTALGVIRWGRNIGGKYEKKDNTVMPDADLAEIYGVPTKRLNEQVRRNIERFPNDFIFKLTQQELSEVVANCDHLRRLKFTYQMPYAFTEHGALMLASVLKSDIAIHASLEIVRAFVRMRSMIMTNKDLAKKILVLEAKQNYLVKIQTQAIKSNCRGSLR